MSLQTLLPIKVLDHGFIRLVDYMGSDLSIVRSARVSYDADWRTGEDAGKDEKLIAYLLRNKHSTPFESVRFLFEIAAPIFVLRQHDRHRTIDDPSNFCGLAYQKYWSYNEVSARYTELPEEFYIPELTRITTQSTSNKQMSSNEQNPFAEEIQEDMQETCKTAFKAYRRMIENGCPRELARIVLPLATYTRFFAAVDLHNFLHWASLRIGAHAQHEIRVYAEAGVNLVRNICPIAISSWDLIRMDEAEDRDQAKLWRAQLESSPR